ncbi:MAG: hypothetical protein JSR65_01185 [Proteobacteria bacterium]|nr:hypothetical protein [Pseudomonadota bacterium]
MTTYCSLQILTAMREHGVAAIRRKRYLFGNNDLDFAAMRAVVKIRQTDIDSDDNRLPYRVGIDIDVDACWRIPSRG